MYNKKTNKELIKEESEELAFDFDPAGKVRVNVLQIFYGKQSLLIYDDFNFDGFPDLALLGGQNRKNKCLNR